jgi:hypothetical protein
MDTKSRDVCFLVFHDFQAKNEEGVQIEEKDLALRVYREDGDSASFYI